MHIVFILSWDIAIVNWVNWVAQSTSGSLKFTVSLPTLNGGELVRAVSHVTLICTPVTTISNNKDSNIGLRGKFSLIIVCFKRLERKSLLTVHFCRMLKQYVFFLHLNEDPERKRSAGLYLHKNKTIWSTCTISSPLCK